MIIKNIEFENFRPFYGRVNIDLTPADNKNIILIGGRNGHGKSNFLLGIVWCLYGKLISDVDETFKAEIAKTNGYSKFLDDALNRDNKSEGKHRFGVKCTFHNVPYGEDEVKQTIHVHRYYDINNQQENLDIEPDDDGLLALSSAEDKQNFINDYLIPIEIARFVFFDAEKISQIADLTIKQQARLLDKALGNMLGLNSYEKVTKEIDAYVRELKRESASTSILDQITNYEYAIKSSDQNINTKHNDLENKNKEIQEIKEKISGLELEINRRGGNNANIEDLHREEKNLENQREQVQEKFNDLADIVPLMMLSGLIQEAKEHIEIEASNQKNNSAQENFSEKIELFIDELFYRGEMPEPDINIRQKIFYAEKSEKLASCFIDDNSEQCPPLPFSHNLDPSQAKHLEDRYKNIQSQPSNTFNGIVHEYTKTKDRLAQLSGEIRKLEISSADEITKDSISSKEKLQSHKEKLIKETGSIECDLATLENEKSSVCKKLSRLYAQSKTNEENRNKIELAEKYIKVLKTFIKREKEQKKEDIKKKLLAELKKLWSKSLVINVELHLLAEDKGLEVTLLGKNGELISSKDLSKGEQQLYISALLKAILDNSIHDLPVFIDTPLARLDSQHRDNILQKYYPDLSTQVVVFSTDTEITPEKHTDIKDHVVNSYLIVNEDNKSSISLGYFQ